MTVGDLGKKIGEFFAKYHLVIFIVIVGGALSAAVFLLSQTATADYSADYTPEVENSTFDQQTIDRLRDVLSLPAPEDE